MTTDAQFQMIALAELVPSPRNHRKHFDEQKMAELTASVKEKGVLQPVLVRPLVGVPIGVKYELVAGERRYRASKSAGLETIPAVVRPMTDEAVLECQAIENGQREDVHPLEEAAGYHDLMKLGKRDAEWIAGRIGKSVKYVYDRLKLLDLTKDAQDLFWSGKIQAGHAILLARLTPAQQKDILGDKRTQYQSGGLFALQNDLYEHPGDDAQAQVKAVSVRELEDYIKRNVRFSTSQVDAFLLPETAAEVGKAVETKRRIIEITHEIVPSSNVRGANPQARVFGCRAWRRADGREKSKPCDRSVLGVVVCGPGQGEAFQVCVNKERCRVHWLDKIRARERTGKPAPAGGSKHDSAEDQFRKQREREAAEQQRAEQERKRYEKALPEIFTAVAAAVKKAPTKATGFLSALILEGLTERWGAATSKKAEPYVKRGTTADDLIRHAGFLAILKQSSGYRSEDKLCKIAKHFHVDVKKIVDQVSPIEQPAKEKKTKANGKKRKAA